MLCPHCVLTMCNQNMTVIFKLRGIPKGHVDKMFISKSRVYMQRMLEVQGKLVIVFYLDLVLAIKVDLIVTGTVKIVT